MPGMTKTALFRTGGEPFPIAENIEKDRKLTLAVCVGVTYLPGPSPAKYCQHM